MIGTKGSAGYVVIEQVTGTLHGRKDSFVLQHMGTMNRGKDIFHLVSVVLNSGTTEFVGLQDTFKIIIANGKHNYDFMFSLSH